MAATAEQLARSLTQDITETQARLDKWIEACKAELEGLEARHEKNIQEWNAEREVLLQKKEELMGKAEEGQRLSKQDEEALAALEADIRALKVQQETLPKELQEARTREQEVRRILDTKKQQLQEMTAKQGEHINNLTRGVLMYKHLGLDFERADDNKLRLIFTQMDAQDPAREFFFSIHVDEVDHYQVEECNPKLDDTLIKGLVSELNTSSDFATFCKKMRRAFKGTIKSN